MRYFLELSYKGTGFHGWQQQPKYSSVQGTLIATLQKVLKQPVHLQGCGRTDAGVHASKYFGHMDVAEELDVDTFIFRMNHNLPKTIAIHNAFRVADKANAQLDAVWRTYEYHIHDRKDVFLMEFSGNYPMEKANLGDIQSCVDLIRGEMDFVSFCKQPLLYKSTLCTIRDFEFYRDGSQFKFKITGNRFLRGMVRVIVGTILEVGFGNLTVEEFKVHLAGKPLEFFKQAFPQGLYLSGVEYGDLTMKQVI